MEFDWLIVGAGFTGAVIAERLASQLNQKVLIIDRRNHIGGNAFDYYDEHGVLVHKYGPHIFHTNSNAIWTYLNQFTSWRPYYHHVKASVEGQFVPVPFNLNSLNAIYPSSIAGPLENRLIDKFGFGAKVPILKLLEEDQPDLKALAKYVSRYVFENYTEKQWGLRPEELDASVTGRVPIYISRDDRYFQDKYQALPKFGYTKLFENLLHHPNISILLQTDYKSVKSAIKCNRLVFTGPIDEYFDHTFGALPYRSLRFELEYMPESQVQEVGTLNYPNDHLFTRTTEFKHLTGQRTAGTTVVSEYPEAHVWGVNDPYYPIPQDANRARYQQYFQLASDQPNQVIFAGRLADYKYYNMDQAVGRALKVFSEIADSKAGKIHLPEPAHA